MEIKESIKQLEDMRLLKRFCSKCSWNDCDYGCTCPANEEVYQCTMYMYYHPDEVAKFEKYVREGVTQNERKAESKETEKGNKIS